METILEVGNTIFQSKIVSQSTSTHFSENLKGNHIVQLTVPDLSELYWFLRNYYTFIFKIESFLL